ncbi:TonB-dependent receptor plug domain-containing protein, partial [Poseidonibacter sp.]|uniref:TonB-dependent receptor plug domain-containing protein n=1 Tax=Poseidonibacter sp. TaxID=2321188 RepID=UPI003C7650F0
LVASLLIATNLYSNENIETITVTSATKSTQSIKDVTSNVEVITKDEIEERHFGGVSEALNTLAGVNIISNGGVGQSDSIFIRGVDSKRILILVDGIRYNEPAGLSGAPLAQLLIDDIEQIEVVKGAQSGIWGADASGGDINIITTSAKKGFHGTAGIEIGSFNTKKYSTTLSNRTELGYIKLNANRTDIRGFSAFEAKEGSSDFGKRGDKLGYERDGYNNNTYSIQAGLNLSNNDELNLSYKKINAKYDYDSPTSDILTNKTDLNHFFKSANYIHTANNFNIKVNAQQSKFDRTQNTFVAKSLVNEFGLQTNINYMSNSNLILGLSKQNFEHIKDELKYQTEGIFISNINKFNNLVLTQSLRYDNNTKFDEQVTGKLGAKYNFTKDLSIASNYGTAYNAPTLSNLSYTSTLKPETTKSFDINAEYKNFKVTYFKTKIKDMIQYISGSYPNTQYENLSDETTLKGYELSYKKDIIEDTFLNLNYTHLSAEDSEKKDLARRAKRQLGFGLDYYGFNKLHLNLNGYYVGDRYDKADKSGAKTGNYTVWNSVVNYEINKNFSTYLKVDNLFNKYYQTVDGYATAERSAYIGLKAKF